MPRRLVKTRALLSIGLLAGLVWSGTLALFTDDASSEGSFVTGSVTIDVAPTTALFTVANMAPGDVVFATLDVQNNGTLEFRYDMETAVDNTDGKGLGNQLRAEVREGACDGEAFAAGAAVVSGDSALSAAAAADRVLAASDSEELCFRVELPDTTDDSYQGAATTATFTFTAVQADNNPLS